MTGLRHLLIATSASPDFAHSQAAQTVCALLAAEFAGLVPRVTVGRVCTDQPVSPNSAGKLAQLGVDCIDLPSQLSAPPPPLLHKAQTLTAMTRSVLLGDGSRDRPCPDDVAALAAGIDAVGADAVLLFWDTLAEFALPRIKTPSFGYLARPPQAAAMARVRAAPLSLRRCIDLTLLAAQSRRHFRRMTRLRGAANICAIDAADYSRNGIACAYVSNSWVDPFGATWQQRRTQCEAEVGRVQMLGNIGALDATGNSFGMHYLGTGVLPFLDSLAEDIDWTIGICGPRQLTPTVASALDHPRVIIKGFVPDLDHEVMSSAIFLLLNNAGPYTGGYTRVIYAFSAGACLIAHRNLALSMPELKHDENCLLADTPEGTAALIAGALRHGNLRRRIGAGARRTYESVFAPSRVAERLLQIMTAGLDPSGEPRCQPLHQVPAGPHPAESAVR